MSEIIYEGQKFNLEFQEYHPPLWLSFWNSNSFLKKYVELSGEDVGFIYIVRNGELTGFMESAGSERLYSSLKPRLNRKWVDKQMNFFVERLAFLRKIVEKGEKNKQTRASLKIFFTELENILGELNPHSNVSYMVSKILETEILSKLKQAGYKDSSAILAACSQPIRETFLSSFSKRLAGLAVEFKKEGYKLKTVEDVARLYSEKADVQKQIDILVKDYFCLGSLNSGKRDAKSFFPDVLEAMQEKNENKTEVSIPEEVAVDVYFLKNMLYFKDECSTFIPPFVRYAAEKIWQQTAKFLCVSKDDLDYLLMEEIIDLLESKKKVDELISKRKRITFFVHHPYRNSKVTEGDIAEIEANKIISQLKKIEIPSDVKDIVGKIGSRGKATGMVHIVSSYKEIINFKEGEVLVTVYTGPEFVPAMKKAAAIVTDTGGITCHAAIVSRELNKPCVVSTGVATKVLKDGDMVEVDAEKGIVRKLKNG